MLQHTMTIFCTLILFSGSVIISACNMKCISLKKSPLFRRVHCVSQESNQTRCIYAVASPRTLGVCYVSVYICSRTKNAPNASMNMAFVKI